MCSDDYGALRKRFNHQTSSIKHHTTIACPEDLRLQQVSSFGWRDSEMDRPCTTGPLHISPLTDMGARLIRRLAKPHERVAFAARVTLLTCHHGLAGSRCIMEFSTIGRRCCKTDAPKHLTARVFRGSRVNEKELFLAGPSSPLGAQILSPSGELNQLSVQFIACSRHAAIDRSLFHGVLVFGISTIQSQPLFRVGLASGYSARSEKKATLV